MICWVPGTFPLRQSQVAFSFDQTYYSLYSIFFFFFVTITHHSMLAVEALSMGSAAQDWPPAGSLSVQYH